MQLAYIAIWSEKFNLSLIYEKKMKLLSFKIFISKELEKTLLKDIKMDLGQSQFLGRFSGLLFKKSKNLWTFLPFIYVQL